MITLQKLHGTVEPPDIMPIRTLLIDNYDSYTYNLYQLIAQVNGAPPTVVYNDEIDAVTLLKQLHQGIYDNIVISPGPGTPTAPSDIGLCLALIKAAPAIPILGVCLGFQALAVAYGAHVLRASEPVHGRLSAIRHSGTHPLFSEIPSGQSYQVVRYHSLVVDESTLPEELEAIAWTAPGGHHALGLDNNNINNNNINDNNDTTSTSSSARIEKENSDTSSHIGVVDSGVLMALAHKSLPYYGVQYHPESIGTAYGHELLKNFKELTLEFYRNHPQLRQGEEGEQHLVSNGESIVAVNGSGVLGINTSSVVAAERSLLMESQQQQQQQQRLQVFFREIPGVLTQLNAQTIFDTIVLQNTCSSNNRESESLLQDTFWLDTAAVDRGRFSFMGCRGGTLWRRISYKMHSSISNILETASTTVLGNCSHTPENSIDMNAVPMSPTKRKSGGILMSIDKNGKRTSTVETSFWDWLNSELHRWKVDTNINIDSTTIRTAIAVTEATKAESKVDEGNGDEKLKEFGAESVLPFDFCGGLIGYLGYELKADGCGGKSVNTASTPDASFFSVDQFIALDHTTGSVYAVAVAVVEDGNSLDVAEKWVDNTASQIEQLRDDTFRQVSREAEIQHHKLQNGGGVSPSPCLPSMSPSPPFILREPKSHYLKNVEACMEALYAGDSYELCLTTEMRRTSTWGALEAWALYKILRKVNPAPYAAWLHFGGSSSTENGINGIDFPLSICCSSPERFLKGDTTGGLEAKPIKGTAPRHPHATPSEDAAAAAALASSEKDRAENLMIVDLLRNDLGRVCDPGTVHVPALMNIESFATVHQLVSTVRGHRRHDASVADAVRAAFPGGSMTGAPKVRSMDIIDQLESGPRGVYSGSLGYFSFNGTFDLNIVIRTAVVHQGSISIGAGGAIVVQSEAEAEYDEMQLKAAALLKAVAQCDEELEKRKMK